MAEPFLAEIKIIGFNFAPSGWAFCDGQILPISQNQSLYSLLGTTYGGDGRTTFALPEMRGRIPIHETSGHHLGQKSGQEAVPLSTSQIPAHDHPMQASSQGADIAEASGASLAQSAENSYVGSPATATLGSNAVANAGGGQGHPNMQPYLVLHFIIALSGTFPSRN